MAIERIERSEYQGKLVSNLPTRPNAPVSAGGKGLTPSQMKAALDALSLLIIEKYNALVDGITGNPTDDEDTTISEVIRVEADKTLQAFYGETQTSLSSIREDVETADGKADDAQNTADQALTKATKAEGDAATAQIGVDALKTIRISLDPSTFALTLSTNDGTVQSTVDFPVEETIVSGSFDKITKEINLVLKSGSTISIPVGDLIDGLASISGSVENGHYAKFDAHGNLVDGGEVVPPERTVNGKSLSNDIDLVSDDIPGVANAIYGSISGKSISVPDVSPSGGSLRWTMFGQCAANGTPSQENPVTITEQTAGATVGDGANGVRTVTVKDIHGNDVALYGIPVDSGGNVTIGGKQYLADTVSEDGVITRRVGKLVFDGTERVDYTNQKTNTTQYGYFIANTCGNKDRTCFSTHLPYHGVVTYGDDECVFTSGEYAPNANLLNLKFSNASFADENAMKAFLSAQYEAGTPVTVYYPYYTPVVEIATVANADAFSPTTTWSSDCFAEVKYPQDTNAYANTANIKIGTFAARPTGTYTVNLLYIATDQTENNRVTLLPRNADGGITANWIKLLN